MKFSELAWAGFCFYYRSAGDKRYSVIMNDSEFISQIRNNPEKVSINEFEEKAILGYINLRNYDLLLGHKITENILNKIIELKKEITLLQDMSLVDCDLGNGEITCAINRIYCELQVNGLWITGASKIAHLLNDRLLPPISLNIAQHFGIECEKGITTWLRRLQWDTQEATEDFNIQALEGTPSSYLSEKLGYLNCGHGYEKSIAKYIDEYFWIYYGDGLPIPPKWIPDAVTERLPINKQKVNPDH